MYQADPPTLVTSDRVLACGMADAELVEMVEYEDGSLVIRVDGRNVPHLRWPPGNVEECTKAYLRWVQRAKTPAAR